MAGTLFHGRRFVKVDYVAMDGQLHYEVEPVDGGTDVVSASNWREVVDYCSSIGVDEAVWPQFENEFDVPLDVVESRSRQLSEALDAQAELIETDLHWLGKICEYLQRGEQIFFAY